MKNVKAMKSAKRLARSDEDKLVGLLPLTLGGETRAVKVLSIGESAAFRVKAAPFFGPLSELILKLRHSGETKGGVAQIEAAAEEGFVKLLPGLMPFLMGDGLTQLVELPFAYAPELEEFRAAASDEELIAAGSEVLGLVFPLFVKVLMAFPNIVGGGGSE